MISAETQIEPASLDLVLGSHGVRDFVDNGSLSNRPRFSRSAISQLMASSGFASLISIPLRSDYIENISFTRVGDPLWPNCEMSLDMSAAMTSVIVLSRASSIASRLG